MSSYLDGYFNYIDKFLRIHFSSFGPQSQDTYEAANILPLAVEPFPQTEGIFLLSRNRSYLWWVWGSTVGEKLAKGIAIRCY